VMPHARRHEKIIALLAPLSLAFRR
jgi:hypothetical protein